MFQLKDVSRKQAVLSHIGISLIIFLIVLYFIVFHWYPQPFFSTDGGWQGVQLLAAVDIVLGPLLTLIIFKPGKKGLKTDVITIATIQFLALFSGLYVIHNERPVAKIFQDGNFYIVTGYDMTKRNISLKDLERYRVDNAITIYLDLPDEHKAFEDLLYSSRKKKELLYLNTSLYKKIDAEKIKKMRRFSIDIERYIKEKYGKEKLSILTSLLKKHNAKVDDFLYLGLHSRYKHAITVLDPETLKFIDVVPTIYKPEIDELSKYIDFDIYRIESYKKQLLEESKKKNQQKINHKKALFLN